MICLDIFNFSSETAEYNSTKLDREQVLNVLYQVCVFQADPKNNMAALASDWLRHILTFPLKPLNGIQRNLTEARSERPLQWLGRPGAMRHSPINLENGP